VKNFKGTKAEERVLRAFTSFMRAAESFTERTHQHLKDEKLTFTEFAVLEALFHSGRLQQNMIADKILKSRGNITLVVDKLEARNLVIRERLKDDRRCINVFLSEQGYILIKPLFKKHLQVLIREMGVLTVEEQELLRSICEKLGKSE
jgi:MarR family transcriptional regulator, 2-MHQ and catechol-resistance regulon repressor